MWQEKEEVDKYREALLMKEGDMLNEDKEVQKEMKQILDLTNRIDAKIESLQLPPPKYYFPETAPHAPHWNNFNGYPAYSPHGSLPPMVLCQNCQIHHHPHHHCKPGHSSCCLPPAAKETYVFMSP